MTWAETGQMFRETVTGALRAYLAVLGAVLTAKERMFLHDIE
jgi:hypothetical protein